MKLSDLKPNDRNPRTIKTEAFARLCASIQRDPEFMVLRPIVHQGGRILGGNMRWRACKELGMTEIPDAWAVEASTLTPEQARRFVLVDNAPEGMAGEWDFGMLAADWELPELEALGFDLSEFDAPEGEGKDAEPQTDRAEELRKEWGVETGQLWTLGEHRLVVGSCTDSAVVQRVMQGEQAQLGLTSPPYAVGKEYETEVSFPEHLELLRGMADRSLEAIVPGGFLFINFGEIASQSHAGPLTGSKRQCLYLISKDYWAIFHDERGMDLYAQRIWYKPFYRLQQPFWTYHTSIPHHQEWEHIWTWRLSGGDGDTVYDWDISAHAVWDTRDEATDDKPLTRHTAAFPVGIPERAIKAHSKSGDLVWEPFCGSGTTIIACEQLGRKCRAIEIAPGYVAVCLQRWADATGGKPERVTDAKP